MITPEYSLTLETALGPVRISAVPGGITAVSFDARKASPDRGAPAFLEECAAQLRQYFAGERRQFQGLPLVYRATDFQRSVWDAALDIPFGSTRTYGMLAAAIGSPESARAVGGALHRNAIAIIVPCHRIVPAAEHETGGYAGEPWRKEWLLRHEKGE